MEMKSNEAGSNIYLRINKRQCISTKSVILISDCICFPKSCLKNTNKPETEELKNLSDGMRRAADVSCNCCYVFSLGFSALRHIYKDLKGLQ